MKIVVEVQEHSEPFASEWERLAQHTRANPFLWPGWIQAWWRAFGDGRLQILTARENGRLTGILPLRRFRGTLSSPTNGDTPLFGFLTADKMAAKQLSHALFSQETQRI